MSEEKHGKSLWTNVTANSHTSETIGKFIQGSFTSLAKPHKETSIELAVCFITLFCEFAGFAEIAKKMSILVQSSD